MAEQNDIAVVILNWNGKALLERFLPGVMNHSARQARIYVADNGSTDGSVQWLKEHFSQVNIIENGQNLGFAGGYNQALGSITTKYIVLLNSDVEVTANWLGPMVDFLEKEPAVAACQPKVLNYDKRPQFDYAGASGGFVDKFGYPFCRGRLFHLLEEDKGQYDNPMDVFWATGACLFIRSDVFYKSGGFDTAFFAHMEEIDLCWRIQHAGYRIAVIPQSSIYHVGGGSLHYGSYSKIFLNYRNNLAMLYKNLPGEKVFSTLLARMLLDGIAALWALFSGKPAEFSAIWAAHWNFLWNLGKWKKSREAARKLVSAASISGWYNQSIVLDVFLRGKRKFSELPAEQFSNPL